MCNTERLLELLAAAKDEVERMEPWMKNQEPAPGVSYEDWIETASNSRDENNASHLPMLA